MKFPTTYRVFAVIAGILVLPGLIGSLFFYDTLSKATYVEYPLAALLLQLLICSAWLLFAALAWFFSARFSYTFLYTTAIVLLLLCACIYAAFPANDRIVAGTLFSLLPALFSVFLIAALFVENIRQWPEAEGSRGKFMAHPLILAAFVLIAFGAQIGLFTYGKLSSSYVRLNEVTATASSSMKNYPARQVADYAQTTWWTPANGNGIGESVKINFDYNRIGAVEILGGSHEPNHAQYGNLYPKNSRLKSGRLVLGNGKIIDFELDDRDEVQTVYFDPVEIDSIELRIRSTYKGEKWDDLSISHFYPMIIREKFVW